MKIAIAPDSYKGTMTAPQAATAIAEGITRVLPEAEIVLIPLADGGEGTVQALVDTTGGTLVSAVVGDPLGRPITAQFGMLGDGRTAVIEMAASSGLTLLAPGERNPLVTSTRGTGQLLLKAIERGARKVILGIGGSATVDGGAGMARALGVSFLDNAGNELEEGGAALLSLDRIDMSQRDPRVRATEVLVACDVVNPLVGEKGAARVYGPQKGATPEMVALLDSALARLATVVKRDLDIDIASLPGAGAAGGLGGSLVAFAGASMVHGAQLITELVGLEERLAGCDLVITGEGRLDYQTTFGKTPMGAAMAAKAHGIPVIAIGGSIGEGARALNQQGIDAFAACIERPMNEEELRREGARCLSDCAEQTMRFLLLGGRLFGG